MAYKALWVQFPIIPLTLSTPLPFTYEAPATLDSLLVLKNATWFPLFTGCILGALESPHGSLTTLKSVFQLHFLKEAYIYQAAKTSPGI